jgi:hypothetical protein
MNQQISFDEVPAVPAGKVRIANYGTVPVHHMAQHEVIAKAETTQGHIATFGYQTRGYNIAGSALRWDEARWSVRIAISDEIHGKTFSDTPEGEDKARAYFAEITDPAAVAKARIERAEMDAICAAIQAEKDAENRKAYLECCAERGLNPNTKKARNTFRWYRGG